MQPGDEGRVETPETPETMPSPQLPRTPQSPQASQSAHSPQTPRPSQSPRPAGPHFLGWALAIFLLAFAVRALHLWVFSRSGLFELLMGDGRAYHDWAVGLASGDWIGTRAFYQAPLYPYLLGVVYSLFGQSLWAARLVQALLGALACVLIADTGRRLFSRAAGIASGMLLALYAPAIFYDGLIQKSAVEAFLFGLVLWLTARALTGSGRAIWLWLGLALGGLSLARENALLFVPVLLGWVLLRQRGDRRRFAHALLLLVGTALVLLPVGVRNLAVSGEFHLTTSQFGPNLFIGNNPATDGGYVPLRIGHGSAEYEQADAIELAEVASGRSLTPGEVSRFWVARAVEFARTQPGRWLELLGRKFLLAWNAIELVDTEDLYTYETLSWPLRVTGAVVAFGLIAPLGVLGIVVTWSRRRDLAVYYALGLGYLATLVLFYVLGRYRMPLAQLLALFAGAGAVSLPALVGATWRTRWIAAAAVLLVALVGQAPLFHHPGMRSVTESNIGNAFFRQGDLERSEEHYRAAVTLDPRYSQGRYNLGVLLQTRGRLQDAAAEYTAALEVSPAHLEARNNLAGVLQQLGELPAALTQYRLAVQTDPRSDLARLNLARALVASGEMDEAEETFRGLLQLVPGHYEATVGLGQLRASQQRHEEAIAFFEQAIAAHPERGEAYQQLAASYTALGRPEEGLRRMESAIAAGAPSAQPYITLAEEQRAAGQIDLAADTYRRAIAADPRSGAAHNGLGVLLTQQGRTEEAIAEYRRAIELEPTLAIAHFNLSHAYRAGGRMPEMVAELERTVELQPDFLEAWTNLGLGYSMLDRLKEAEAAHRRVIALEPDFALGHAHLGTVLLNQGRAEEARRSYERAVELDPDGATALRQLAWILATHQDPAIRDPQRAVALAERANGLARGQDLRTLDTLAIAYAVAQRYDDAIRTGEGALALARSRHDDGMARQLEQRIAQFRSIVASSVGP